MFLMCVSYVKLFLIAKLVRVGCFKLNTLTDVHVHFCL